MSDSAEQKSKEEEEVEVKEEEEVFGLCRWYYHPNSSSNDQYCSGGQAEAIIGLLAQSVSLDALYVVDVAFSTSTWSIPRLLPCVCVAVWNQSDYR